MSASRFNPKDPRLIVGVVIAVAVVVVFNARTFAPDLFQSGGMAGLPGAQMSESSDLTDLIREATRQAGALGDSTGMAAPQQPVAMAWSGLGRDPFLGQIASPVTSTQKKRKAPPPLTCSAVLIAGEAPTAIINGKSLRAGQTVRGYTIVSINTDGVRLIKGNKRTFLPVNKKR